MEPQRILIVGGTGFIGRALAHHLVAAGHAVQVLARNAVPPEMLPSGTVQVVGEVGDAALLRRVLPGTGWLVHLACESVPGSNLGPVGEAEVNLLPTLRLLEVLREFPAVRMLVVSTGGALYGDAGGRPATESAAIHPWSGYAAGKASVEAFVHAFCRQHEREAVVLRPSNVYGPGQPVRPGFGIVPALLHAAAEGSEFEIWGDGETVRDFLYIGDFVELCGLLLQRPLRPACDTFNAGSGEACSINRLGTLLDQVTGRALRRRYRPARRVDLNYVVLDSSKVRAAAGWQPRTGLVEGLTRAWQWYSDTLR